MNVAAADDFRGTDNAQRCGAQHLKLFVAQCLAGRYDHAVACVNAHGVYVFHAAYGDAISLAVAHDFKFDFFPAFNAFFNEHLIAKTQRKPAFKNGFQFGRILRHTAAGAAQGVGGSDNNRVAYFSRHSKAVFNGADYFALDDRLVNFFHQAAKAVSVFPFDNGFNGGADHAHVVFVQNTFFV